MEEAKKEAYFDVVISVSIPRSFIPTSDESYPLSDVPHLRRARQGPSKRVMTLREMRKEIQRVREEPKRELQAKIMAELKINVAQSSSTVITNVLSNWLARRRFLIILTDVWEHIELKEIGVPLATPGNGSKIIFIPASETAHKQMGDEVIMPDNLRSLSEDQAWQLLNAEARDAAATLLFYPNIITASSILECFSYVSLFGRSTRTHASSLREFWRSEGLLDELTMRLRMEGEEEDMVEELTGMITDAPLAQLSERCMLDSFQDKFKMPNGVRDFVSSHKRYLIKSNSSQVPESNEWEGAERISLSNNQIQELPTKQLDSPPNCQRLLTLFLNHNENLKSMSDDFFKNMTRIQVLDLSATGIKFLPPSISCLRDMRMLKLRRCSGLEGLPTFLEDLQQLEVVDLGGTSLPSTVEASFDGMPSLRILDISDGAVENLTQFSVKGYRSLSRPVGLQGLSKLEALDLSGTKIERLPHQIFNLIRLERLQLLGMERLKLVEWNEIKRLPKQLNWHRWSLDPLQEQLQGSNGRLLISASNDSLFLDHTSHLSKSHLRKFYFLVCPCERGPKYKYAHFKRNQFPYSHFYAKHENSVRSQRLKKYERWVEVCGAKTSLTGIRGVLSMADFYCLRGNESIETVFDGDMKLGDLRECWIEKCHQLESVIHLGSAESTSLSSANLGSARFTCLKHLYLQCCPKLTNFFSSSVQLKQLQLLEIKFCGRLQNVQPDGNVAGQDAFPQLAEVRLWELGKLKRLCSGYLPKLKKLKVRGCPLLKQLPLNKDASAAYVEIEGEAAWCKSIEWEGGVMPKSICFKDSCSFKG